MNEILEKYSTRLINISGRNRSLVMKKLYKKRAFDITRLNEFDEKITDKVIEHIISRSTKELKLTDDPFEWFNTEVKLLESELKKQKKEELLKHKSSENYIEEKATEIEVKYAKRLEESTEKLGRKQEKYLGYSSSIKSLVKEIKDTEKETGRYELYIGYPFVEGYFKDKTFTKAPLFLFPIELIKKGDKWYLKNKIDSPVALNKVFLIAYAKFNEEKISNVETEYDDLDKFGKEFISGAIEELRQFNIIISYKESETTRFKEITKDTELNYKLGELVVENNIVVGHFSIANSIYTDYKDMENNSLSNRLMFKLLKNEQSYGGSFDLDTEDKNKKMIFQRRIIILFLNLIIVKKLQSKRQRKTRNWLFMDHQVLVNLKL